MEENNKKERLTEKQILKRKNFLLNLEKELKELENEVDEAKKKNAKNDTIRRLKISLRTGQLIAPYLLVASITFSLFSYVDLMPFVRDDQKCYLKAKKVFDSLGNIRYENQYKSFNEQYGSISYIGKWNKYDDTFYSREVKTYNIKKADEETINKIVNDNDIDALESIFSSPESSFQVSNNLTEEDLNNEPYIEATLYSTKENDFITIKEPVGDNIAFTFTWIIITLFSEVIPYALRDKISHFNYDNCVYMLKQKYPIADINELTRKLEIAKSNYNRLTR